MTKASKIFAALAAAAIAAGAGWYFYSGSQTVSAQERRDFGEECVDWIKREYGDGRETKILDAWKKSGKVVFEIATRKREGSSYTIYPCVYDPANHMMTKPSAFDSSWHR